MLPKSNKKKKFNLQFFIYFCKIMQNLQLEKGRPCMGYLSLPDNCYGNIIFILIKLQNNWNTITKNHIKDSENKHNQHKSIK